jgi:hypothetical protein
LTLLLVERFHRSVPTATAPGAITAAAPTTVAVVLIQRGMLLRISTVPSFDTVAGDDVDSGVQTP